MAAGFLVLDCAEPLWPASRTAGGPLAQQWASAAANATYENTPAAIVWHHQRG